MDKCLFIYSGTKGAGLLKKDIRKIKISREDIITRGEVQ